MHARNALTLAVLLAIALPAPFVGGAEKDAAPPVAIGKDGRLTYNSDKNGNRIIDFSACGYRGGGVTIPNVPAKLVVGTVEAGKVIDFAGRPDNKPWLLWLDRRK